MASGTDSAAIEAVDGQSDFSDDSAFNEPEPSTASLRSSIFNYEEEYGRSYHAFRPGKYVMPNDEREQERMDIHYHAYRMILENQHWVVPVERPAAILDVGTGTGIWAMDVADDHPNARVIAIDLSPIQPTSVPPNLEFEVMDADEEWDFTEKFELVHTRYMNGFSIKSWPHFYSETFKCMRPGGWVENQEFDLDFRADDGTQLQDGAVRRWMSLWEEGIRNMGLTSRCDPDKMKSQMEEAGFVNVTVVRLKMPIGRWPKDKWLRQIGLFMMVGLVDGLSGLSQRVFTKALGWSVEEMEVLLMEVRNEWQDSKVHSKHIADQCPYLCA